MRKKSESAVHSETVNVSLVGDAYSGKTEFFLQYQHNYRTKFSNYYSPTTQSVSATKSIFKSSRQPYNIELKILDTPGQEIYQIWGLHTYYKSHIVALFIDVSIYFNEEFIDSELEKIYKYSSTASVFIVMSRSDLIKKEQLSSKKDELAAIIERLNLKYKLKISNQIQVISSKLKLGIEELEAVFITEANEKIQQLDLKYKIAPSDKFDFIITRHPIATAMLAGLILGILLSATGLFVPFGATILGSVALSAVSLTVFGMITGVIKYLSNPDQSCSVGNHSNSPNLIPESRLPFFRIGKKNDDSPRHPERSLCCD